MTTISNNLAGAALSSATGGVDSARAKLGGAAKEFEAIFVRQMLSSARKASFGDDLFGSSAVDTFRDMQDSQYADLTAKTGTLGLAKQIEAHLAKFVGAGSGAKGDTTAGAKG
ncbi:MAG: flagellar rod assembly protein FlgJ [Novosphingobium sp.]|nr:flagellar rod assembly protein FlgJ [Novosphingobium sp.]